MTRRNLPCLLVVVACSFLLTGCFLPSSLICDGCKARPPKSENLTGIWIGFDEGEGNFYRLDLRPDATGFFASVSPSGSSLHEYGVQAYRVTHWSANDWKFVINILPATPNAEPIYLRGDCGWTSLDLEVGGKNGEWKRKMTLSPESRMDSANKEIKAKIVELEKR
jgi:hypothetical protein